MATWIEPGIRYSRLDRLLIATPLWLRISLVVAMSAGFLAVLFWIQHLLGLP